jgi:hypothetical protein
MILSFGNKETLKYGLEKESEGFQLRFKKLEGGKSGCYIIPWI